MASAGVVSFRALKYLRKVVLCAGNMNYHVYLNNFTPYGGEEHPQAEQIGLQLLFDVPQLLAVAIGPQEWRRDGKTYVVGDNQDEWRYRAWWT